MEKFSVLLAFCTGNSPVTGEFPTQSPVTRSFDVFFDLRLNKRLSKQWRGWWFETPSRPLWRHCNDPSWPIARPGVSFTSSFDKSDLEIFRVHCITQHFCYTQYTCIPLYIISVYHRRTSEYRGISSKFGANEYNKEVQVKSILYWQFTGYHLLSQNPQTNKISHSEFSLFQRPYINTVT